VEVDLAAYPGLLALVVLGAYVPEGYDEEVLVVHFENCR